MLNSGQTSITFNFSVIAVFNIKKMFNFIEENTFSIPQSCLLFTDILKNAQPVH